MEELAWCSIVFGRENLYTTYVQYGHKFCRIVVHEHGSCAEYCVHCRTFLQTLVCLSKFSAIWKILNPEALELVQKTDLESLTFGTQCLNGTLVAYSSINMLEGVRIFIKIM